MKKLKYSSFIALMMIIVSCQSYDEGGWKSKAEKRLPGTWKLVGYYWNGNEATNTLSISNYVETYSEDKTFTRSYLTVDQENFSESGSWGLNEEKEAVDISGVSSIEDFSENNTSVSSTEHIILRLKKKEYWYYYENGGDSHEFRFEKQ